MLILPLRRSLTRTVPSIVALTLVCGLILGSGSPSSAQNTNTVIPSLSEAAPGSQVTVAVDTGRSRTNGSRFTITVPDGGAVISGGECQDAGNNVFNCKASGGGRLVGMNTFSQNTARIVIRLPTGVAKGEKRQFVFSSAGTLTWTSPGSGTGLEAIGSTDTKPSPGGRTGTYGVRLINGSTESKIARVVFTAPAGIGVVSDGMSSECFRRSETQGQCTVTVASGSAKQVLIGVNAAEATAANSTITAGLKLAVDTSDTPWDVAASGVETTDASIAAPAPTTTTTTTTAAPLDTDGDGKPDSVEGTGDDDGDGIPNFRDPDDNTPPLDTDGDGKPDSVEGTGDDDGDGIPNFRDPDDNTPPLDTDGDGKPDSVEGTGDDDGDGIPNFRDPDDNTPRPTTTTTATPTTATPTTATPTTVAPTTTSTALIDTDGDGKPDSQEGTLADSDGDGILDYLDPDDNTPRPTTTTTAPLDTDGDGIPDSVEGTGDRDGDGIPNYLDANDNSPLPTTTAAQPLPTSPTTVQTTSGNNTPTTAPPTTVPPTTLRSGTIAPTTSLPNVTIGGFVDSDGDGRSDRVEGTGDIDGDGIPNYLDPDDFTPRMNVDTDGDGTPDNVEGTGDRDGDGIPNYLDPDDNTPPATVAAAAAPQPIIVRVPSPVAASAPATTTPATQPEPAPEESVAGAAGLDPDGDVDADGIPNRSDAHNRWITGRVYVDENRNSILDGSDSDPGPVTIELVGPGADRIIDTGDDVAVSRASSPSFRFSNLSDGPYRVRLAPAETLQTPSPFLVELNGGPLTNLEIPLSRAEPSAPSGKTPGITTSDGASSGNTASRTLAFDDSNGDQPAWVWLLLALTIALGVATAVLLARRQPAELRIIDNRNDSARR